VADATPSIDLYRAAALTGLSSTIAAADMNAEAYKRIAQVACDLAQAVADEASGRAKAAEAQTNRKY
jgi:hypothetical protein